MKGDFSRFTFDSKNRYSRVLMQQGRVQLDADWNEQLDISAYRTETEITDFIGQSGAPENNAGFVISVIDEGTNLKIGQGRFYIEGMLFENYSYSADVDVTFTNQPDFPNATIEDFLSKRKPDGKYLVYLDVCQHHITALEAPTIRDIALGGADTTTRVKNVWQVKLCKLEDADTLNRSDYGGPGWQPEGEAAISEGKLTVKATPGAITENQLYRVEIHQGNEGSKTKSTDNVSFKWSRDNGAIAAQVEASTDEDFIIKNAGRDADLAFPVGALVEFSNANLPLNGKPGILATVKRVQSNRLTVEWKAPDTQPPENLKELTIARRWDCSKEIGIESFNEFYELEQSITVKFELGKLYKTGDYWLIPSRALTGSIEWSPEAQSAHGIRHRYCSLALLERKDGIFSVLADWRSIFKPITSGLLNKAGDTMTGSLTIDQNLSVTGKAAIGYNSTNQTAALAINGNVGIGTTSPGSMLSVAGGVAIGSNSLVAASDGQLLVQNSIRAARIGIGTLPNSVLSVAGEVAIGYSYAGSNSAPENGLLVEGNIGVGTPIPQSKLSVAGGVAIGSNYSFRNAAPNDGLIVEGNLGIGEINPKQKLVVTNGKASVGYNDADQTAALAISGNLGIGTTSPKAQLEISGSLQATGNNQALTALHIKSTFNENSKNGVKQNGLIIENGNVGIGTTNPISKLTIQTIDPYSGKVFRCEVKQEPEKYYLELNATTETGIVRWGFKLGHHPTSYSNVLVFDQQARVGIGVEKPTVALDVNGIIKGVNTKPLMEQIVHRRILYSGTPQSCGPSEVDPGKLLVEVSSLVAAVPEKQANTSRKYRLYAEYAAYTSPSSNIALKTEIKFIKVNSSDPSASFTLSKNSYVANLTIDEYTEWKVVPEFENLDVNCRIYFSVKAANETKWGSIRHLELQVADFFL
ncbi:DUF6519 domain-containing protein [Leptolyngbya sp. FACHB-16]|uniref:DUF6519 domain-containing protein n=1 Tax=unclassified Leptolyngbya TaxID=2650499 RepID=UPI0016853A8B|nr:DUF6519 domain-containing protein [Leptolyngbya sp. FACHB-16]MBD2158528.1 hypothetical protein [Leptolyngbya sp. FACHB-16]